MGIAPTMEYNITPERRAGLDEATLVELTGFPIEDGITCEWFALCQNRAVGIITHPVLGDVPCCLRCADKFEMTFA